MRAAGPPRTFERGDIGEMAFADGTFDGIIGYYSIIDTPKSCVGRLLVAVKAGGTEGYLTELLGMETEIYFSLFTQDEIRRYYEEAGFSVEFLEQRNPYDFEINAERIFAIGGRA